MVWLGWPLSMDQSARSDQARQWRPGTVLLVDDDPKFVKILQEFLELNGFRVVTASSGEEAVERLRHVFVGVVLLDIKMAGMDGLLTLKRIRVAQPNLPVIFITNVDEETIREEARILGAHEYIVKPLDFEHLKNILLTQIFA